MSLFKCSVVIITLIKCSVVIITLTITGAVYAADTSDKKTPAEIISVTEANLLGHKSLYKEGWFVVSSSEKAFSYAKEHSITASGDAMSRAIHDTKAHSEEYGKDIKEAGEGGVQLTEQIFNSGTELSKEELKFTGKLIRNEWDYGAESLNLAWQRFVRGNMTLSGAFSDGSDVSAHRGPLGRCHGRGEGIL
jgi:hypothetical protein